MAERRARPMILQSIRYHFHRLEQAGSIVTVYDEDDLRLAETKARRSPDEAFAEARKIVDGKVEDQQTP
jgi:hypothetical protein